MNQRLVKDTPLESPPKLYETVLEMMKTPIEDLDFLVGNLFPRGEFAAAVGMSGVNKST